MHMECQTLPPVSRPGDGCGAVGAIGNGFGRLSPGTGVAPRDSMAWHHFTVDVEEYFQVSAFERIVPRFQWASLESRVARSVDRLLDLLARHNAQGTFFVVGWLAQRHPNVVRSIVAAGHEIGSHTWDHVRVTHQTP